jgi:hypothetical protein
VPRRLASANTTIKPIVIHTAYRDSVGNADVTATTPEVTETATVIT